MDAVSRREVRNMFTDMIRRYGLRRKNSLYGWYCHDVVLTAKGNDRSMLWRDIEVSAAYDELSLIVYCESEDEVRRVYRELRNQLKDYPNWRQEGKKGLGRITVTGSEKNVTVRMRINTEDHVISAHRYRLVLGLMNSLILRNFSKEIWHKEFDTAWLTDTECANTL